MSDKGETSRKAGSTRVREERRESQDSSNRSMKINVMYRGIVYRVRGIKVLCSVITAVILLLVAIVGLGVWMLVSAYGEEKADNRAGLVNETTLPMPQDLDGRGGRYEETSTVVSIDFNAPSVTIDELSLAANLPSLQPEEENVRFSEEVYFSEESPRSEEVPFNEAIGHFQGVTPSKDAKSSHRMPGPDPPFGLFSGMIDLGDTRVPITTEFITSSSEDGEWGSVDSDHIMDSFVELSEYKPVAVAAPSDFYNGQDDGTLHGFIRNSNGQIFPGNEGSPIIESPSHPHLPDNFPRDIDPKLVDSEIPFPFPPTLTPAGPPVRLPNPRPGWRRNNPRQPRPGGFQRMPQGIRRARPNLNARPPYYQHPTFQEYGPQFYDPHFTQKQGFQTEENPPADQDSEDDEGQTDIAESPVSADVSDLSLLQQYNANGEIKLPAGITLPPGFSIPDDPQGIKISGVDVQGRRPGPGRYLEDMMHYYNKHERPKLTTTSPSQNGSRYSERAGLSEQSSNSQTRAPWQGNHDGQSEHTDEVFDHFRNIYNGEPKPPAEHDDRGPVPEETMGWGHTRNAHMFPNPNIRGLRPGGQGYPIQIRPDAENPDRILAVGPDRILAVEPNGPHPQKRPTSVPNQHRPLLGPLADIYQYSQKLASTLLNFPSNLFTQVADSRAEHMKNEVQLLEDYNKLFQENNITSADLLPDMFDQKPDRNERLMILDTEKIRSLNPFELSLITWTFLDFWEFLIEKVGTLSKDDLRQLENRLDRLRKEKDHRMAKSLVDVTIDHVSKDASQSEDDIAQIVTMTEEFMETLPEVTRNETYGDHSTESAVQGRMWDPLGIFTDEQRMQFMHFAIKVVFRFGRVYLNKRYALDCMMLLFCKDLNSGSKKSGMDGMAAKVKSVGLKVLIEKEDRQMDTMGEVWRALTAWETLQCEDMFPKCDGPKALEIVNEVALAARK
ncbi:uncharacterized protein LOC135202506 [Macrobrachium nipponense]|uniref:uncharacterized protein LOC135202506 n=1 Tax=Macrobrachium nipponense TaxID=159736 RepID=UPI0030C83001